jgi:cell division protein FtsW
MSKQWLQGLGVSPFYPDKTVIALSAALLLIGYLMVTTASLHLGVKMAGNLFHYPIRQMIHIFLGLMIASVLCVMPMSVWQRYSGVLFIAGLVLLAVVLIPGVGVKVNGSVRWISLAGLRIQVSEIIKFASVIYMAGYVLRHQQEILESGYGMLKPLVLFVVASILLLLEPDLGSAVVIIVIAMGMMFLAGARIQQFLVIILLTLIAVGLLVWLSPYRWARITAFIDPWADAKDTGFQLVQALIAFGQGSLLGVGLGNGIQKLFYLPEAHTDFLFSVLAEEWGLLGVLVVVALFAGLVWRTFMIASLAEQAGQQFNAYVAYGLGIWIGFQAFVNMGVNMGLLPTKGITLPLMSYGGGSMLVMCAAVALLLRVSSEVTEQQIHRRQGERQWASA